MSLPGWMPSLLEAIEWGCVNSPMLVGHHDADEFMKTGQSLSRELWPFIRRLPTNIAMVRDALPNHAKLEGTRKLFSQLSDEELFYQKLYIRQCKMFGISEAELFLANGPYSLQAERLLAVLRFYCHAPDYRQGVLAIITAELAASAYCRTGFPMLEECLQFTSIPAAEVEEGLEWLRLHAKPHTKHALWMIKTIKEISSAYAVEPPTRFDNRKSTLPPSWVQLTERIETMPEPVRVMLYAILSFWRSWSVELPPCYSHVLEPKNHDTSENNFVVKTGSLAELHPSAGAGLAAMHSNVNRCGADSQQVDTARCAFSQSGNKPARLNVEPTDNRAEPAEVS